MANPNKEQPSQFNRDNPQQQKPQVGQGQKNLGSKETRKAQGGQTQPWKPIHPHTSPINPHMDPIERKVLGQAQGGSGREEGRERSERCEACGKKKSQCSCK